MNKIFITSESVTEGHPDKICDQISDAILDAIIKEDPEARVACETVVTTGLVLVVGEITTETYVDIPGIIRQTVTEIGYTRGKFGFDADNMAVLTSINEQSPDIAQGVDESLEFRKGEDDLDLIGAGDQGMMFGYANNETKEYMPLPITLAHKLTKRLAEVRKKGILPYILPDGKSQVTVEYVDDKPKRVDAVVIASQHTPDVSNEELRKGILVEVIQEIVPKELMDEDTKIYINETGRFEIGGPKGDAGLTGRKIIVDTYGGFSRHGGGAFSGKDPTKVDRSGAYLARYIAKNLVASGLCDVCEIGLSYAIGVSNPVSVLVETFGTAKVEEEKLVEIIRNTFDMRPAAIIKNFDLLRPIYQDTATYGHFGREDLDLPWEKLDKIDELKKYLEE